LHAHLTEQGIELSWNVPEHTSGGEPVQAVAEYHVYRGELDPASTDAATKDLSHAVWKMPLLQIAATKTPEYRDSTFDYGNTYVYLVRSVSSAESSIVESGDSQDIILTPQDTFPPAAPQGIVSAVLPGVSPGKYVVDLSWAINVEPDLAGYRVYRSEQQGVRGASITSEPLPTPAYRDDSVEPGKHYWYTITAVDHAGNESAPSEQFAAEITPASP
jgi:fibronectin type 3 domain-containing protein